MKPDPKLTRHFQGAQGFGVIACLRMSRAIAGDAEQSRKVDRRACDELRRQEQREHDREAKRRSSLCHRHNAPLLCGRRPPAAMSLGISPLGRGVEVAFWHHSETADEQDK